MVGEKPSSAEKPTPPGHSECPAPKTPATNSMVPDIRIYETAGQLAATVADYIAYSRGKGSYIGKLWSKISP